MTRLQRIIKNHRTPWRIGTVKTTGGKAVFDKDNAIVTYLGAFSSVEVRIVLMQAAISVINITNEKPKRKKKKE